jgi:plasmid stability protein
MGNILIRNVPPTLKRRIEVRARRNRHSLSDEVKLLIENGLASTKPPKATPERNLGTYLFSLLEEKHRGDDLVFEIEDYPVAPDLK